MRFRQLIKRSLKPLIMAGVAATVALSLVVTTPSNAQAFVPVPILPAVFGATEMAIPTLMATSSVLGPVGWGIAGATAVGIGIYATRDYWLPYVTGLFGTSKDNPDAKPVDPGGYNPSPTPADPVAGGGGSTSPPVGNVLAGLTMTDVPPRVDRYQLTFSVSYSGGQDFQNGKVIGFTGIVECRRPNGSTYKQPNEVTGVVGNNGGPYASAVNVTLNCAWQDEVPIGGVIGAFGSLPELAQPCNPASGTYACNSPGPERPKYWGTLQPATPAAPTFDPRSADTKYRVEAECIKPDGSKATATAFSAGNEGGIKMPSCEAAGLGHGTGKVTVWATPPATAPNVTPTERKLWEATAPTGDPNQPLCDPKRPGSGCKLAVQLDKQPCLMGDFICENWSSLKNDPAYKDRLSCQYGPYTVPIETCNPLERGYEPGGAPGTNANTDGDPTTRSDTGPDGQPQPRPADPSTGVGAMPGGPAPSAPPGSTPEQAECFPSGWGLLNPVEWVMKPVGCALDAAFTPKKPLETRLAGMQGQFSNKVPMSWFGVGMAGAAGGACPADWAVTFKDHRYSLICGTEAENIIRGFRPVLGAMLTMAMLWPFVRSLFYAAIPVFKVNPS